MPFFNCMSYVYLELNKLRGLTAEILVKSFSRCNNMEKGKRSIFAALIRFEIMMNFFGHFLRKIKEKGLDNSKISARPTHKGVHKGTQPHTQHQE